jgi:hypothetical protein
MKASQMPDENSVGAHVSLIAAGLARGIVRGL